MAALSALTAATPAAGGPPRLAFVEVLDRDGSVRQCLSVNAWPLRIGRDLDNDLVLGDPFVAAAHLRIAPGEHGLEVQVLHTRNGVQLGARRLTAGEQALLPERGDGAPIEIGVGRSRLRLRLAGQPVGAELPMVDVAPKHRQAAAGVALLVLALSFVVYLDSDPDAFARALGSALIAACGAIGLWCGVWALLSKTFTRQARFGWHLRVAVFAALALFAVASVPALLAFALSRPGLSSFAFVATIGVGAVALYLHLLAVEPARPRLLRRLAVAFALAALGLSLWLNQQRGDRFGEDLYLSHLFPPALRLARPVAPALLVDRLGALKPLLDAKARESAGADVFGGHADAE